MILGYWLVADSHVINLYKFTNPTLSKELHFYLYK